MASYAWKSSSVHNSTMSELGHPEEKESRKSAQDACTSPDDEWVKSLVGRDWEIFWKQNSSEVVSSNGEDDERKAAAKIASAIAGDGTAPESAALLPAETMETEEEEEHDDDEASDMDHEVEHVEDWYDATVLAFDHETSRFRVSWIGEETVHLMALTPDLVRPSARAWIRRTRAILKQPGTLKSTTEDDVLQTPKSVDPDQVQDWERKLPPDTSLRDDHLQSIQKSINEEFPLVRATFDRSNLPSADNGDDSEDIPTFEQHRACRRLIALLRSQLYTRTRLAPIDVSESEEMAAAALDAEDPDPTEDYVNYLVQRLRELEEACQWHYLCWKLLCEIFDPKNRHGERSERISRDFLLRNCLQTGRTVIATLAANTNTSAKVAALRSKAQKRSLLAVQDGPHSPERKSKRRRKSKEFSDFWIPSEQILHYSSTNETSMPLDNDDLVSAALGKSFVQRAKGMDARWFSQCFGTMLQSILSLMVVPYVRWERRAQFYLGERATLDVEASDGETSEESSDEEEECGEPRRERLVKYAEVQALISAANEDRVLLSLDLVGLTTKLREKLSTVDSFETRAWNIVNQVLDDDSGDKDNDRILQDLKRFLHEAESKESPVGNMEPIGKGSPPMTRKILENAIVYRTWLLDLRCAETMRERVAFVDDVVSRLSKLPPLSCPGDSSDEDTGARLQRIAPRVQALSARNVVHAALFQSFLGKLNGRELANDGNRKGLLTAEGARDGLVELGKVPVISVAEEKLAVRLDVLSWETVAHSVIETPNKIDFTSLNRLKAALDLILDGRSESRSSLVSGRSLNRAVDAEIREFAQSDLESLCGSLFAETNKLTAAALSWKDRADSVLTALQAFGNRAAGDPPSSSPPKLPPAMVDLKRVEKILEEYDKLDVDLFDTFERLVHVREAAAKWSTTISNYLKDDMQSFEGSLQIVEGIGRNRPCGIIVDPTRHVVELLSDLLQWYCSAKESLAASNYEEDKWYSFLLTGLEVVEKFGRDRKVQNLFVVPGNAMSMLKARQGTRRSVRTLSVSALEASPLCLAVLGRMTDESRDKKEGHPLFVLLCLLWAYVVDDLVHKGEDVTDKKPEASLATAKELLEARPSNDGEDSPLVTSQFQDSIEKLERIVDHGNQIEQAARDALSASKSLLREASQKVKQVTSHLSHLKELHDKFRSHTVCVMRLVLDPSLEQSLEQEVKLFGWLVRTFLYPVLQSDDFSYKPSAGQEETGTDGRVPWDVLVSLHGVLPSPDIEKGDFALIVFRVKELHEAAKKWQAEISNFTMLSLRGGKRRTINSPVTTEEEGNESADVEAISKFCDNPILSKVAMPREKGIRNLVENTEKFEVKLHKFLGQDYDGDDPDRVAIPEGESLVGKDGTFLLFRLTGSPLFQKLKTSLVSISEVADDVFAATPGKAAFDWIRQAVDWIESIQSSVTVDTTPFGLQRLAVPSALAKKLLQRGEEILLNMPDDLRQTMSHHKIHVSSNKDGKLTVKSNKGGAHHAVGATALRWCPFLFDALKQDVTRLSDWEISVKKVSEDFLCLAQMAQAKLPNDPSVLLRYHKVRERLTQLLDLGGDLVVSPPATLVESCRALQRNVEARVRSYSNRHIRKNFAETRYVSGLAVTQDRFQLLDSLVNRLSLKLPADDRKLNQASRQGPFRIAARLLFVNALKKGAAAIDIIDCDKIESFCAVKAWEIENALYDHFQAPTNKPERMSREYKEKARALRRSLEDPLNVVLCGRVLTDKINVHTLVQMSTDELANPRTKKARAKAAAARSQGLLLTKTGSSSTATNPSPSEALGESKPAWALSIETESRRSTTQSTDSSSPSTPPSMKRSPTKLGDLVDKVVRSLPPPPPPSLVAPLRQTSQTIASASSREPVTNSSGGDRFLMSVAGGTRRFFAGLTAEVDPESIADGLLPENLKEKARVSIPEFRSFLKDKVKSDKYATMVLSFAPLSDNDLKEYKKFYRDYEQRKRVAMFPLSDGAKLFLLSPKYSREAKILEFKPQHNRSYAVILLRRKG